jgi:hypothetical protein
MGILIDADKATHDELRQLSGRNIKALIQIEPLVWEPNPLDSETENLPEPRCMLGAKVTCGTDEPYEQIWFPHLGKREGEEWERSKLVWKHLYQYVKDYIGAMMMLCAKQLMDEASHLAILDEEKLKTIFSTSADLQRFYEALGSIHKEGVPHDSEFQMWIGVYAFRSQERITGKTKVNIGSDARLRFSPMEMKQLLEALKAEKTLWQRARDVFWTNERNPEWRDMVKAECRKLNERHKLDDDLLDAIAERTERGEFKYDPLQVARVCAARHAGLDNKEHWYSPPTMGQHKRIQEAIKEWQKRFDEAKQLNLRW